MKSNKNKEEKMLFILIGIGMLLIGGLLTSKDHGSFTTLGDLGFLFTFFGIASLALIMMVMFVMHISTYSVPEEAEALQLSLDNSRGSNNYENVAVTKDVIEFNRELAVYKKYNRSIWLRDFINNCVDDVKYIK